MKQKIKLELKGLKDFIVRFLWPEVCPFCERVYKNGVCPECKKILKGLQIKEPRCMKCGKPLRYQEQEYCYDCMKDPHFYDRGFSVWLHKKPVNQSIYQFKYHNRRQHAIYYAEKMMILYEHTIKSMGMHKPDVIIPIPLHKKRQKMRGYNQSEIIAGYLGEKLKIPVEKNWLIRTGYTEPQKKLNRKDRKKNLQHVFSVTNQYRPVKTVLLIDDIYTTGSTIDSAAKALKSRGTQIVYFLTISIGQGY